MHNSDNFTGERFIPGVAGEIAYEHCHRYAFARAFAHGKRVLDAACGEGYGAMLLADVAESVVGVDIDAGVVSAAQARYGGRDNLRFETASVAALPLPDQCVDVVASFETIEHLPAEDQPRMLEEFVRVLAPGGLLILSSPNRVEYSELRGYTNPFHLHELDREGLVALLRERFPAQRWYRQRRYFGSAIWSERSERTFETLSGSTDAVHPAAIPAAMYFIVVAARSSDSFDSAGAGLSLYVDDGDAELTRIDRESREVMRLDALLGTRDEEITGLVKIKEELQAMVAHRDHVIATREAEKAQLAVETQRLLDAQERIIAYREGLHWWWMLPWLRLRRLWRRLHPS